MGNVLDSIRKQRILEGPVAVNSDFESDYVELLTTLFGLGTEWPSFSETYRNCGL